MIYETLIVNALKTIGMPSNVTVVLSDRNGIEPNAPYLLINVYNIFNVGLPRKLTYHKKDNVVERMYQVKDIVVSFTFHALANDVVHDWVDRFHHGLSSDLFEYAFAQQGLGIVRYDDIRYQNNTHDTLNYKRAIIDVTFRTEVSDEFTVNSVEQVNIKGNIVNSYDDVEVDIDYNEV